ncbi:MAG: molybdopterin-dependent oxidoreductase [Candidatus Bathyarchaeia archaeon]
MVENRYYTFCDACNQMPMCGMRFYVENNKVVKVDDWPDFPNSPLCTKGYATQQLHDHQNRLLYPLKRTRPKDSRNPNWVRISWDEAYILITSKLREIREKYGSESVVFFVGNPKEPRAAVQRLCYTFGSPNYATESSTCRKAAELAELLTFGFPTLGSPPTSKSKLCVIWGSNPAWSHPELWHGLVKAKEGGVKFVVVDPRKTPTVECLADLHLQLRPATDGALALAIINVMIREELYDKKFVENWVFGFEELKEYVNKFTPEMAEKITWVSSDNIVEAAHMIARNNPVTFLLSASGTTHNTNGVQNHRAILSLIALTGCIDIPGGITVPTYPLIPNWSIGSSDFCRRDEVLPIIRNKRLDLKYFPVWANYIFEVQINQLPEYVKSGKVKAMIMWGVNSMMWPQTHEYQEAIRSLEFSVAIDIFYRPWTHDYVDIVLPAATCFERKAPFAFFDRKVYGRKVLPPLGECREDWQIAFDLGVRLGYGKEFWNGNVEEGLNNILKKFGITLKHLEENLEEGVELPPPGPEVYKKFEVGKLRADGKPGFPTPTGKVEVYSTILKEHRFNPLPEFKMPMEPTEEYPLILITGCRVPYYTHSRRDIIVKSMPYPIVNIHPRDAAKRGIEDGDDVYVTSPWGKIEVKAYITPMMPPGVVDILHGWTEANVNELIPRKWDPISGFPPFKECICEVRKVQN